MASAMGRLEEIRILVTGAGGGIGAAICRRVAAEGAAVIASDIDEGAARAVAEAIGGESRRLDIADARACADLAAELGAIDVLVNNAGWDEAMPFLETTAEFWEKVLRINLFGHIALSHAFGRLMAERGRGRIVNIASDAGKVGSSGETTYAAAKGGLIAFTKSLAREMARHGVTANCVCPGPTETPLLQRAFPDERGQKILESMRRTIPLRRFATPEDVAACVAYLASDDAAYLTGQAISVDGGLVMN
jgi:2-hydroxycyclohexanecarboxyl-CoA dehydrogenase